MLEYILGGLCLLIAVAVIGHGIWLSVAGLIRLLGGSAAKLPDVRHDCSSCGAPRSVVNGRCYLCGATPHIAAGSTFHDDVAATVRQLNRLVKQGSVSPQVRDDLLELVRGEATAGRRPEQVHDLRPPQSDATTSEVVILGAGDASAASTRSTGGESEDVALGIIEAEAVEEPPSAPAGPGRKPRLQPEVHPLDRPEPAQPPSRPRAKPLAALLQAFMEDKNIRWGEIISGLLIVVCAVGLVVSLWATLRDSIPYLPALVFMLGTAAFHAAGHYTLRSWKLDSVSRAVLIIGMLLIPLNFLAAIALTGRENQASIFDPAYLAAVIVGLGAYGTMAYFASRALLDTAWWRLMVAVMGASAGQLVINRNYSDGGAAEVSLMLALPLFSFLVAAVGSIWIGRQWKRISWPRAESLFLVLGLSIFAFGCPVALLVAKSEDASRVVGEMAPAMSLVGAAVLCVGLLIHRRTTSRLLASLRMSGTALAILGGFGLLLAIVFAWPEPVLMIAVGLVNAVLLGTLAVVGGMPVLHIAAAGCGALAYVVAIHLVRGEFSEVNRPGLRMMQTLASGQSALILTSYAALTACAAAITHRLERARDTLAFLISAAGCGLICILLALGVGFLGGIGDEWSAPVLIGYAIVALIAGFVAEAQVATVSGSALLLFGLVQALWLNEPIRRWLADVGCLPDRPVLVAFLVHGLSMALASLWFGKTDAWSRRERLGEGRWRGFIAPLSASALASTIACASFVIWVYDDEFGRHAAYSAVIALVWLGIAALRVWPRAFSVGQGFTVLSLSYLTTSYCQRQSWWSDQLLDFRHLHLQAILLAAWCSAGSLIRTRFRKLRLVEQVVEPVGFLFDRCILVAIVVGLFVLALTGCLPGALHELGHRGVAEDLTAISHTLAFGDAAWVAMIVAVVAVFFALYERPSQLAVIGFLLSGTTVVLLFAGPFENHTATASAIRWFSAVYAVLMTLPFCARDRIAELRKRLAGSAHASFDSVANIELAGLALSAGPVLLLTTWTVIQVAAGNAPGGPDNESIFYRMGSSWSYAFPLAAVSATLLILAVRERTASFALAGSVNFQYLASLACLLPVLSSGRSFDAPTAAQFVQWNAVGLGLYSGIWLLLRRWIEPDQSGPDARSAASFVLRIQIAATAFVVVLLGAWATAEVISHPSALGDTTRQLGSLASYAAVALAAITSGWFFREALVRHWPNVVAAAACCLVAFLSASSSVSNDASNWLSFHILCTGYTVVVVIMTAIGCWHQLPANVQLRSTESDDLRFIRIRCSRWMTCVGVFVILASLVGWIHDPTGAWWSLGAVVTVAISASVSGYRMRSRVFAFASPFLAGLAAAFIWRGIVQSPEPWNVVVLGQSILLASSLVAIAWLVIELNEQLRFERSFHAGRISVHQFFGVAIVLCFVLAVGLGTCLAIAERTVGNRASSLNLSNPWSWWLVAALFTLLSGSLWDRVSRHGLACLYVLGHVCMALVIDEFDLQFKKSLFAFGLAWSLYTAVTGLIWMRGADLATLGSRLKISDPVTGLRRVAVWLPTVNGIFGWSTVLIGLVIVLSFDERSLRVGAGFFPALFGVGSLAVAQGNRRSTWQLTSLILFGLSGVYLGWADIEPRIDEATWLSRAIRLLMVACSFAFLYSIVVARWLGSASSWIPSLRRAATAASGTALFVLGAILSLEAALFIEDPAQGAPIDDIQLIAVAVVMVALIAALFALALLPQSGAREYSERARMAFVYAAQGAGALLFAHIYLARPMWFNTAMRQYWPFIVMGIAFAGAAVGSIFQRAGIRVLSEPFQKTGAFLPLIPAIGMWIMASGTEYSSVLFSAGLLYVFLSFSRRSTVTAAAAAIVGNAALWALLHERGFQLWEQPQLWMIPPAISVLAAAEINKRRISEQALTAARYASMLVIYLSSAGEMFIRGIGEQLWPPMVLLGLSVLGSFLGVILRIRAFLFVGTTFVFLSVTSMVWHAARAIDHVWPWWAFGIGLGLAILIMFGVFEKKRDEINVVVKNLRKWER